VPRNGLSPSVPKELAPTDQTGVVKNDRAEPAANFDVAHLVSASAERRRRRAHALRYPTVIVSRALTALLGAALVSAACSACAPTLSPTTVPPQLSPAYEPFKATLQGYVDQTQPFRKEAAREAEKVPGKSAPTPQAEQAVRTRQNALADALRSRLRPDATQGDLFNPTVAAQIRTDVQAIFDSPQRDLLVDELAEQNNTPANSPQPTINQRLVAPRVPPRLIEVLPPLPKQLEYDFAGRALVLRDVDADVVVDYLPDALAVQTPQKGVGEASARPLAPGATSPLPMPQVRGGTIFGIMGDSGSGDEAQQAVAQAMLTYQPSDFDEVGLSEHHFMIAEIAGDRLLFEAISHLQKLIDCGIVYRAPETASTGPDEAIQKWLRECEASRPNVRTTQR